MERLKNEIIHLFKSRIKIESIAPGKNNAHYFHLKEKELTKSLPLLLGSDFVLADLFCVKNFENIPLFTLFYVFTKHDYSGFAVLYYTVRNPVAKSIAWHFPTASWYEREIADGFGIDFSNSFDKRRLFLHEVYPDGFHPLLKSFVNGGLALATTAIPDREYEFKELGGEGVYQIPVGPVHAGIIEPGHFRFSVIGETVYNLEIRMFYKHRGLEKLAEDKTPAQCLPIAESISGDETAANTVCFCNAIEKISDIKVGERSAYVRMIFLELERIYSLLGDLAGMVVDVAYPVGASELFILREEIFRQNERLTGSRFLKGAICIGGVNAEINPGTLQGLRKYLGSFLPKYNNAITHILNKSSIIDRFETTGIILKKLVSLLNLTGPIARSANVGTDARIDHPYCLYNRLTLPRRVLENSDVFARFKMKSMEIADSAEMILAIMKLLPKKGGEPLKRAGDRSKDGYALSVVEAARGQNIHWVYIRKGKVYRYKIRTASLCNWQAIEHAVIGNIVPDFPLINKSLNLSYAGTDL